MENSEKTSGPIANPLSPYRLLFILVVAVFVAELTIMTVLLQILEPDVPISTHLYETFFDASILTVILFPVLQRFSLRPLLEHITRLEAVEKQLKLQTTAVQTAANGIMITDREGVIEWVNPALETMTGYVSSELVGHPPAMLLSNPADTKVNEDIWNTLMAHNVWKGELVNRRKDGSSYHEEQTITPILGQDGAISHFVAIKSDITTRKVAEKALVDERNRLYALFDQLPAIVYLKAADYSIRFANGEFRRVYGEPSGRKCFEVTRGLSEPCAECTLFHLVSPSEQREWEQLAPNGRYYQTYDYPFTDIDGSPLVLQIGFDVSDRKHAEDLIRQSAKQSTALVEISRAFAEAQFNFQEVLSTTAQKTAELIGDLCIVRLLFDGGEKLEPVAAYHHDPELLRVVINAFPSLVETNDTSPSGMVLKTGQPVIYSTVSDEQLRTIIPPDFWHFTQRYSIFSVLVVPLTVQGKLLGTLALTRDHPGHPYSNDDLTIAQSIADRATLAIENARLYDGLQKSLAYEKQVRSQLVQTEKLAAMGRMVASVAHELNNPLQTIKNCLFLTQQELPPHSPIRDYLNMAADETQRLSDLVLQLRDVYRRRTGELMREVELHKLIIETRSLVASHLRRHKVTWIQALAPEEIQVAGIPDQLKQVFLNITINAIEAMEPDGGRLVVATQLDENIREARISFRDDGNGIPSEAISRIFDPFYSTKDAGTGLGLAVSYDIIRRHGGTISVESAPQKGTEFIITLPLLNPNN